jgi:hypothetical protein
LGIRFFWYRGLTVAAGASVTPNCRNYRKLHRFGLCSVGPSKNVTITIGPHILTAQGAISLLFQLQAEILKIEGENLNQKVKIRFLIFFPS